MPTIVVQTWPWMTPTEASGIHQLDNDLTEDILLGLPANTNEASLMRGRMS